MSLYSISVPERLYQRLKQQAESQKQSLDDLVEQALVRQLPPDVPVEDDLPTAMRQELLAMEQLSDAALWQLAITAMQPQQLEELDQLQAKSQSSQLTADEQAILDQLLTQYYETILRRAHAAMLLSGRGHDFSDPAILAK